MLAANGLGPGDGERIAKLKIFLFLCIIMLHFEPQ